MLYGHYCDERGLNPESNALASTDYSSHMVNDFVDWAHSKYHVSEAMG